MVGQWRGQDEQGRAQGWLKFCSAPLRIPETENGGQEWRHWRNRRSGNPGLNWWIHHPWIHVDRWRREAEDDPHGSGDKGLRPKVMERRGWSPYKNSSRIEQEDVHREHRKQTLMWNPHQINTMMAILPTAKAVINTNYQNYRQTSLA